MEDKKINLIHAAGINTDLNSPLQDLMLNLAKDLVKIEQQCDTAVLNLVTETYEKIYKDIVDIQNNG